MRQAMIFAAGLGTRLKPLTDTMPKALVRVGDEPLLFHVLHRLRAAGFERIVVNVHHFADQIEDYLAANHSFGLDIHISDERQMLLETGGGIRKALTFFDENSPILIHNVDILSNVDLRSLYDKAGEGDALLLVSHRQTQRYLLFGEDKKLRGWTNIATGEVRSPYTNLEPNDMNQLAFSGIHVISPSIYPALKAMPERFGIMDFYIDRCADFNFLAVPKSDLKLIDVGKLETLERAEDFLRELKDTPASGYMP